MDQKRGLFSHLAKDLKAGKMVFIGGPRQVGKTTLALSFVKPSSEKHPGYLNWDSPLTQEKILKADLPWEEPILVFDEIHKFARWRNWIKGIYDTHKTSHSIIVTGSARLDYYRKGGDSLVGRYHYYRLHPFSLGELDSKYSQKTVDELLRWGGFPEPFFKQDSTHWRRWHRERIHRVLYEDLRDLEQVKEVSLIDLLMDAIPERVGSPLSIEKIREVLQTSHNSVERWIEILERLYLCFRIPPYGSSKIRAVKKEKKIYLWDWSRVPDPGPRFENLVASQLLKYCHWMEDTQGFDMELRYLRDVDKREVDFVVLQDKKPVFAVECKTGENKLSSHLKYFSERTPIPVFYQVHMGTKDCRIGEKVFVLPFSDFCQRLKMP